MADACTPNAWPPWRPIAPFVRTPEDILPPEGTTAEPMTRPRPQHKRAWASLEQTPAAVITAMFDEAEHRDPHHRKTWVALVDGNKPQIRILRTLARKRHLPLQIVVDFIHVAEYVWKAGLTFHPAESQALDSWVRGSFTNSTSITETTPPSTHTNRCPRRHHRHRLCRATRAANSDWSRSKDSLSGHIIRHV